MDELMVVWGVAAVALLFFVVLGALLKAFKLGYDRGVEETEKRWRDEDGCDGSDYPGKRTYAEQTRVGTRVNVRLPEQYRRPGETGWM